MKPHEDYHNGDVEDDDDSSGSEAAALEAELSLSDDSAPARVLGALNALRKSRQHYDVLLLAAGAEVPAHRAVLAAVSPFLLERLAAPDPALAVDGVEPDALRDLVEYAYTGKLRVSTMSGARRLYLAARRLRVEAVRGALAARLLRRLSPGEVLPTRALPDLAPDQRALLDRYIAQNFEELCSTGALGSLPVIRLEMLRASSAEGGAETPVAVAGAALRWLQDRHPDDLEELCSRTHLLFVDAGGALRDCGELPERGAGPELLQYRREAQGRAARGERGSRVSRSADSAVLAARALAGGAGAGGGAGGAGGATRALLALGGQLAVAHISWSDVGEGVAVGGVLGGARGEPTEGERRARLPQQRCAHGVATLRGRLLACGGYDRARVLQDAVAYDPTTNTWTSLPNMRSARARFPAARLGDAVYIVGGSDGHSELDSVDVFRLGGEGGGGGGGGGRWGGAARLPLARSHAAAAADEAGGALYVLGGWAAGRSLRLVHKYSPHDDAWTEAPPLTTGRSQCAGVWWEEALWALGGCDAWHCLASAERLPRGGGWAPAPALPAPRRSMGGAVWRGRLVSVGGSDGAASHRNTEVCAAQLAGVGRQLMDRWSRPAAGARGAGAGRAGGRAVRGRRLRREGVPVVRGVPVLAGRGVEHFMFPARAAPRPAHPADPLHPALARHSAATARPAKGGGSERGTLTPAVWPHVTHTHTPTHTHSTPSTLSQLHGVSPVSRAISGRRFS